MLKYILSILILLYFHPSGYDMAIIHDSKIKSVLACVIRITVTGPQSSVKSKEQVIFNQNITLLGNV